jgi:hypothetical protein
MTTKHKRKRGQRAAASNGFLGLFPKASASDAARKGKQGSRGRELCAAGGRLRAA